MTVQQTTTNTTRATNVATDPKDQGMIMSESVVWGANSQEIYVDGMKLPPNRSNPAKSRYPATFSWGHDGSGSAQAAFALLLAAGASEREAVQMHHDYQSEVVSRLSDSSRFILLGRDIIHWLETSRQNVAQHV